MQPLDIFYSYLDKHWKNKTPANKKKDIERTLKKLHKNYCIVSGDLTIKEQVSRIFIELEERGGWKDNVWLKIYLGVKQNETNLGTILTHDKFTDVHLVFAGPEAFDTTDRKLFHFEGKDKDESITYISKKDIKSLSYSNYCHWPEKYRSIYRKAIGLPEDFDGAIANEEEKEEEVTTIKIKELDKLKKQAEEVARLKQALIDSENRQRTKHEMALFEAKKKINFEEVISGELDKRVHEGFYEFHDPFLENYWFMLKSCKKIELAKHARRNNISLESAIKLYRDVKNAF